MTGERHADQGSFTSHELASLLHDQGPDVYVVAVAPDGTRYRVVAATDPAHGSPEPDVVLRLVPAHEHTT